MKFSCEKALLQSAIATASRATAPKSSIPALEGILLEAGSDLLLTLRSERRAPWFSLPGCSVTSSGVCPTTCSPSPPKALLSISNAET